MYWKTNNGNIEITDMESEHLLKVLSICKKRVTNKILEFNVVNAEKLELQHKLDNLIEICETKANSINILKNLQEEIIKECKARNSQGEQLTYFNSQGVDILKEEEKVTPTVERVSKSRKKDVLHSM